MRREELVRQIDHTLLDPAAGAQAFRDLADEAARLGVASVCVPSSRVALVRKQLGARDVPICAVVGFPHGNGIHEAKAHEAALAVAAGAGELDMVVSIGALRDGDAETVRHDIAAVVRAAGQARVKVILETGLLNESQLRQGTEWAIDAGAHYVKTSTGFGPRGASVEDVRIMREVCGDRAKVKAAGGIRSLALALSLLRAGADRLGCSRTSDLLAELPSP